MDKAPLWDNLMEWVKAYEQDCLTVFGKLQLTAEPPIWDRQIAQVRGILFALKLLQRLPEDARATIERGQKRG